MCNTVMGEILKLTMKSSCKATHVYVLGCMKWTPDGTVLGLSWKGGGLSLWSVFGSLLTVSLRWDYTEDPLSKAITITDMVSCTVGFIIDHLASLHTSMFFLHVSSQAF